MDLSRILAALREPSSYAGLAAVASGAELLSQGGDWRMGAAAVLGGLAAVLVPERGRQAAPPAKAPVRRS